MYTPEKQFYTAVAVAAIVLGVIIAVFIITMIRHQRRNIRFHKLKIKAEIAALEKERKRIANDIHDELGPILSAVKMQINDLSQQNEKDAHIVKFANKHIDRIIATTREISYNLLPNTLERSGLAAAIDEYVDKMKAKSGLKISTDISCLSLPKDIEINIYRVIQEIVHNAIKHARAEHLFLKLKQDRKILLLIAADDGIGFDYEKKLAEHNGLGLVSLQSRVEILNATFSYRSEKGLGTHYIIEIPIKSKISGAEP